MSQVVEIARKWLGTKFHHQGRKLGVGVDCIGLIVEVGKELGLSFEDRVDYAREPMNGELQAVLEKYLVPAELKPGCVVLFKLEKEPQHVGIITDYNGDGLGLIHAYAQARKVVEHNLDASWRERITGVYEYPGHGCKEL